MKCIKCKSEWVVGTTISISATKCPFCGIDLAEPELLLWQFETFKLHFEKEIAELTSKLEDVNRVVETLRGYYNESIRRIVVLEERTPANALTNAPANAPVRTGFEALLDDDGELLF